MTEPNYTYRKGEGWVVECARPSVVVTRTYDGKLYRLTVSLGCPGLGERGWWVVAPLSPNDPEIYTKLRKVALGVGFYTRGEPGFGWDHTNNSFNEEEQAYCVTCVTEPL